jgi:phospholipase/carboxylesterase
VPVRATLAGMRRLLALGLLLIVACEPRAPDSTQPQPQPRAEPATPTPSPAPAPGPEPEPELAAPELPEAAGVHYLEFVTADADPEAELVMIVAIHGLGDQPEHFAELLRGFDRPVRVIVPRALDPSEGGGWSWFPIRARDPDVMGLATGIDRAANALAPAISTLVERRPTKGKPIVTGFSQGGMLSFYLAVRHSQLFAAAFPVGGWLPPPLWPDGYGATGAGAPAKPPIHAFHGADDLAVKLGPTEAAVAHLRKSGYRVELDVYPEVGHAIPPVIYDDLLAALRSAVDAIERE